MVPPWWETFKKRPWFFIGSTVVILLASGLIDAFTGGLDSVITGSPDQPSVMNLALGTLIGMGATAFYLAAHDDPDTVDLSALWHQQGFLKYSVRRFCSVSPSASACAADRAGHHFRTDVHVLDLPSDRL
jgi:hypothetical protein